MNQVVLTRIVHRNVNCIKIAFEKNEILDKLVRTVNGCRWSQTHRGWYVPDRKDLFSEIFMRFKEKAYLDLKRWGLFAPKKWGLFQAVKWGLLQRNFQLTQV